MFYRFSDGSFVEAETFSDAKERKLKEIQNETEDPRRWSKCTCVGLNHYCGREPDDIPF